MDSKKGQMNFSILTLILVIVLVAALGFWLGWYLGTVYPTGTSTATPTATTVASKTTTPSATADWHEWTDDTYGFTTVVNSKFSGYRIRSDRENTGNAITYYRLYVPTTDTNSRVESLDGYYANIMVISVFTPANWDKEQAFDGPKATYLGKNNKYVFGYSTWQDAPADLQTKFTKEDFDYFINNFKTFNI